MTTSIDKQAQKALRVERALKLALEALKESLGYVEEEAENAQRLYGQYPTRQERIQGLKDDARKHMDAITAIREALMSVPDGAEQPAQQKPVPDALHFAQWTAAKKDLSDYILVGSLSLAGIEDGEYGTPEINPFDNTIKALQEKLMTGPDRKKVPLVAYIGALNNTSPQPAQQQDPVVVARVDDLERGGRVRALAMGLSLDAPLYTSPQPSKPWVGLTDEECDAIYNALDEWAKDVDSYDFGLPRIAGGGVAAGREVIRRAIEAKLRELNEHKEKNA